MIDGCVIHSQPDKKSSHFDIEMDWSQSTIDSFEWNKLLNDNVKRTIELIWFIARFRDTFDYLLVPIKRKTANCQTFTIYLYAYATDISLLKAMFQIHLIGGTMHY